MDNVYEEEIRKEGNDCYMNRKVIVTKTSIGSSMVYIITGMWQLHGSWVDGGIHVESSVHKTSEQDVIERAKYWLHEC